MTSRSARVERFQFLLRGDADASTTSDQSAPGALPASTARNSDSQFEKLWRSQELRKLAQEGIPDEPPSIRPATYLRLLNLSNPQSLAHEYSAFLAEVERRIASLPPPVPNQAPSDHDKTLREIERDVERTFGALSWFSARPASSDSNNEEREDESQIRGGSLWDRIRILNEADRSVAEELSRSNASAATPHNQSLPPPPTLTLNIPSSLDTTTVDIPPSPHSPTASHSVPRQDHEIDATCAPDPRGPLSRREKLLRPLFIYAFLNPGVSYVQGMSYLAAVFDYIFASNPALADDQVEATTFFAMSALISQLQDLYDPTLDSNGRGAANTHGIGATFERFQGLLSWLDPVLADALDRKHVELGGVILRWLTTVFANEFSLPDLVRIWDRVISVYPHAEQQPEALSPVLSHILDLSLALVITNRSTYISPYSNLSKVYAVLQAPVIEGSAVDGLLSLAWDIRERRLGRQTTTSGASSPSRRISNPSQARSLGGLFKQRLWSPIAGANSANDYELETGSSSDSQRSRSPSVRRDGGGSFGPISISSPRSSSGSLANNVTMIDGKVLPPPPARMEEQETIASIVEAELATPEYGIEDDEGEAQRSHSSVSSLGGWFKNSVSRLAASDAAANLSKRATNLQLAAAQSASTTASRFQSSDTAAQLLKAQTNLAIQAQLLKDRVAAEQIASRMRDAGERMMASTASERGHADDSGPRETPFTPPTGIGAMRSPSPSNSPGGSNAPRPLLLSSAARRANNSSVDETSDSPLSSRRNSTTNSVRSPSTSPVFNRAGHLPLLSPDLSIPPLSRSPSRGSHGRSTSTFDTPTRTASASNFRPRSASQSLTSHFNTNDDDVPIVSSRLADASIDRRKRNGSRVSEGRTDTIGKGWTLTDAPLSDPNSDGTDIDGLAANLAGLAIQIPPPLGSDSVPPPRVSSLQTNASVDPALHLSSRSIETSPASTDRPTETPFVPPAARSDVASTVAPRSQNVSSAHSSTTISPPLHAPLSQPSLSRGAKVVRRPAATKKRSSRSSSMVGSIDLGSNVAPATQEERKIASEFLTRSSSGRSLAEHGERRPLRQDLQGEEDSGSRDENAESRSSVYDESSLLDSYAD